MSETTNIPWCDSTWNWVMGCTKVSPGCVNCYAEVSTPSRSFGIEWGDNAERRVAADATFNAPLKWRKKPFVCDQTGDCVKEIVTFIAHPTWKFHRRRVFSLSLGDWLDPKIPVEALARALDIIRLCPELDFLLCTKRPELFYARMRQVIEHLRLTGNFQSDLCVWVCRWTNALIERLAPECTPSNVWVIASVEDQQRADERIPHLLNIPAVVRGLSCEPLLGPVDLRHLGDPRVDGELSNDIRDALTAQRIHWVIVGGESGPKARPCNVEWIRNIKDQCQSAGVPVFVKQLGSRPVWTQGGCDISMRTNRRRDCNDVIKHPKGGDIDEFPQDLKVREFPNTEAIL